MGACDFAAAAHGKTAREAFARAVERAQWEHGHGGYTGTVAEKHDFVEFQLPPRVTADKMLGWMSDLAYLGEEEYLREDVARAERYAASKPKGRIREANAQVKQARKRLADAQRDVARAQKKMGAHYQLAVRAARVFDDKWGPAVAFKLTAPSDRKRWNYYGDKPRRGESTYLFCGMASS